MPQSRGPPRFARLASGRGADPGAPAPAQPEAAMWHGRYRRSRLGRCMPEPGLTSLAVKTDPAGPLPGAAFTVWGTGGGGQVPVQSMPTTAAYILVEIFEPNCSTRVSSCSKLSGERRVTLRSKRELIGRQAEGMGLATAPSCAECGRTDRSTVVTGPAGKPDQAGLRPVPGS
jgi:hypothetical protein